MKNLNDIIAEGLLSGMDDTLAKGDSVSLIYEYVNFLAKSKRLENYGESDVNTVLNAAIKYNVLSCGKPGEIICDYSRIAKIAADDRMACMFTYSLVCSSTGIEMNTKFLPKSIKKITFKNFDSVINLDICGDNDLSGVDLEYLGKITILTVDNNSVVKLGKITCDELQVRDNLNKDIHTKGISLKTGSTINTLDLSKCRELGTLIGKKLNINNIALHPNFVEHIVRNSGFAKQDTCAYLVADRYK